MQVADLFAALRLRVDRSSFKAGDRLIKKIKGDAAGLFSGLRGNLLGIAGAVGLVQTVTDALDTDEALGRLDAASKQGLGSMDAFHDRVLDISNDQGVLTEELIAGTAQFISLTGNADAASKALDTFAKVNVSTGASMNDITKSASAMSQNLDILPGQFERAFAIVNKSGKEGAVELKDAAGLLAKLTPLAAQFAGGKGLEGLASTISGLQFVRQVSGSARQASTRFEALMGGIVRQAKKFEKVGVKVFTVDENGVKNLNSIQSIIKGIAESELIKDPTKLADALGSKEAAAAFIGLSRVKGAWDGATESALEAINLNEDYAIRTNRASFKVRKALNKVKNAFASLGAFMIKVFAGIIDNMDLVIVVFASLIITIGILKAAAIGAAIASGAAWAIAFGPVILIVAAVTAGIAAVILVLEDLFNFITGNDSVLGDLVDAIFGVGTAAKVADALFAAWRATIEFLGDAADAVWDAMHLNFGKMGDLIVGLKEPLLDIIDTLGDMLSEVLDLVGGLDTIQIGLGLKDAPEIDQAGADALSARILSNIDGPSRPVRISPREAPIGGSNSTVSNAITINVENAVNGDADTTATVIGDKVQDVLGDMIRDTQEQTAR